MQLLVEQLLKELHQAIPNITMKELPSLKAARDQSIGEGQPSTSGLPSVSSDGNGNFEADNEEDDGIEMPSDDEDDICDDVRMAAGSSFTEWAPVANTVFPYLRFLWCFGLGRCGGDAALKGRPPS